MIDQPADAGLIDQLTPVPPGRLSVKETPLAVLSPVLAIVTVNPIGSPALTLAASAVFVTVTTAGATLKHSVVWFVCEPARYCEAALGVYTARKQ